MSVRSGEEHARCSSLLVKRYPTWPGVCIPGRSSTPPPQVRRTNTIRKSAAPPLGCRRLLPDVEVRAEFQVLNHLPARRIDPQYAELTSPMSDAQPALISALTLASKTEQGPNLPRERRPSRGQHHPGLSNIVCFVSAVHVPKPYHAPAMANHAARNV